MASLIMSFPAVGTVSWFDQFSTQLVSNCHRGLILNAYLWDELADLELPVFFSTSKQHSLFDLPFLLLAFVSALY